MADDGRIDFEAWVSEFRRAVELGEPSDVPCDGCTACCRSSQFVHIGPDEQATLRRIDPALLVAAPGRPGHWVMGYDEEGRCPMLGHDGCRIYEDRPRTCRIYDCRVFAATGVEPDQPLVAERAREWSFSDHPARGEASARAAHLLEANIPSTAAALRALFDLRL